VTLLLVILAGIWALVLVPPYLRNRSDRPSDSISSFHRHLHTLERTRPGARALGVRPLSPLTSKGLAPIAMRPASSGMPAGRAEARRRRRDVLLTLAGTVVITLVLAVVLGGAAVLCQLVADMALGGYVYLLVQMRKSDVRTAQVHYLRSAKVAESVEPVLLLNRTASR